MSNPPNAINPNNQIRSGFTMNANIKGIKRDQIFSGASMINSNNTINKEIIEEQIEDEIQNFDHIDLQQLKRPSAAPVSPILNGSAASAIAAASVNSLQSANEQRFLNSLASFKSRNRDPSMRMEEENDVVQYARQSANQTGNFMSIFNSNSITNTNSSSNNIIDEIQDIGKNLKKIAAQATAQLKSNNSHAVASNNNRAQSTSNKQLQQKQQQQQSIDKQMQQKQVTSHEHRFSEKLAEKKQRLLNPGSNNSHGFDSPHRNKQQASSNNAGIQRQNSGSMQSSKHSANNAAAIGSREKSDGIERMMSKQNNQSIGSNNNSNNKINSAGKRASHSSNGQKSEQSLQGLYKGISGSGSKQGSGNPNKVNAIRKEVSGEKQETAVSQKFNLSNLFSFELPSTSSMIGGGDLGNNSKFNGGNNSDKKKSLNGNSSKNTLQNNSGKKQKERSVFQQQEKGNLNQKIKHLSLNKQNSLQEQQQFLLQQPQQLIKSQSTGSRTQSKQQSAEQFYKSERIQDVESYSSEDEKIQLKQLSKVQQQLSNSSAEPAGNVQDQRIVKDTLKGANNPQKKQGKQQRRGSNQSMENENSDQCSNVPQDTNSSLNLSHMEGSFSQDEFQDNNKRQPRRNIRMQNQGDDSNLILDELDDEDELNAANEEIQNETDDDDEVITLRKKPANESKDLMMDDELDGEFEDPQAIMLIEEDFIKNGGESAGALSIPLPMDTNSISDSMKGSPGLHGITKQQSSRRFQNQNESGNSSESLIDIKSVENEYYETNELPKDKTRFLWIMSCDRFVQQLLQSQQDEANEQQQVRNVEGEEENGDAAGANTSSNQGPKVGAFESVLFRSGNGRTWRFEIQHIAENEELVCLVRGIGESGKSQVQVGVKMWAISESSVTIERSGSIQKTFSRESESHSFRFAFELERILEGGYSHVVFEVTLGQLRLLAHNSKQETGYVGIQNEGMTCYINSFLQTLFHLKAFVKLVYAYPTSKPNEPTFPHTLQELFYQLQTWPYQCSTAELLKSFAWDRSRARIQQDVQEFSCLFIDFLEKKAEQVPQLKGQIKQLFQGKIQTRIRCIDVKYESLSEESFFDISLNLLGCKDIYASLDDYVREEKLEGENKYDTGRRELGKQDAKKGTRLLHLPPVVFFHLKRFQFDQHKGINVKITDSHKYYEEIDLRAYMASPDPQKSYKYRLFAVLVHSGEMSQSGHYYAYIRPTNEPNWFKFNDATVENSSSRQALQNSFGGRQQFKAFDKNSKSMTWESVQTNQTAYMLVYIASESVSTVLRPIVETSIPKWVVAAEEISAQQSSLRLRQQKYIEVRMTTFDLLKKYSSNHSLYFQKQTRRDTSVEYNESIVYKRDVERGRTFKDFYSELCSEFGLETEDISLWKIEYSPSTGGERITNETKRIVDFENETIERFFCGDSMVNPSGVHSISTPSNNGSSTGNNPPASNSTASNNNGVTSQNNSNQEFIYLILPVSNSKRFGGTRPLFEPISEAAIAAATNPEVPSHLYHQNISQLQIRKQSTNTTNATTEEENNSVKKRASQADWNKYFSFQDGSLMLIVIKTFEFTRSEGVRIQCLDYLFISQNATYEQLCCEIEKRFPSMDLANRFYREHNYSVTPLDMERYRDLPIKNVFNSVDSGVIVLPFENEMSLEFNVNIESFFKEFEDSVRVRFVFHTTDIISAATSAAAAAASAQNGYLHANNQNNIGVSGSAGGAMATTAIPANAINAGQAGALASVKNTLVGSIMKLDLNLLFPGQEQVVVIEQIVEKQFKYSQLQLLLFASLKEAFKSKIQERQNELAAAIGGDGSENGGGQIELTGFGNEDVQAMQKFLALDSACSEYIYFKVQRVRSSKVLFEEIPYFSSSTCETSVADVLKHFEGAVVLGFDFSKSLRAKERDHKIILNVQLFANSEGCTFASTIVEVEKSTNLTGFTAAVKRLNEFKELHAKESKEFSSIVLKTCVLSKENPNRIETYLPDSTKVAALKGCMGLRVEFAKEINETEINVICHFATKNGVKAFECPFAFGFSVYKSLKALRMFLIEVLSNRKKPLMYDGRRVVLSNRDLIVMALSTEYSKYNGRKIILEMTSEKQLRQEIDLESLNNKQVYVEIQFTQLIAPSDSKVIKFNDSL